MLRQANVYFLTLVSLCVSLIIGASGCGDDDDNEWVGTWSLETVDGESIQAQFEALELLFESLAEAFEGDEVDIDLSYTDDWTFDDDGTWDRKVTMVAPNEDNVVETTSFEVIGTYSLSDSNYTLKVTNVTDLEGSRAFSDDIDIGNDFGPGTVETGTWLINGNTLTLQGDTGQVLGFKKK